MRYGDFRTGLTYEDIFLMLWRPAGNPSEWIYKRRHTVLGKWNQVKREMWAQHLTECASRVPRPLRGRCRGVASAARLPADYPF